MATLRVTFSLTVEGNFIDLEQIQPNEFSSTVDGDNSRRTVALTDGNFATLDVGEITPRFWYLQNVHATGSLVVSFGSTDDITLAPGEFAFLPSGMVPLAKGSGGASKLLYAAFA